MLVIILFFCQLLLGNYSWIINKYFLPEITRNFLITGLPYFWLGMITKEHIKMIKVNFFTWKIIIILGLISLIEANLLEYVNWIIDKDIYITTILLSYAIFIKMIYINNKFLFNISFIGKKYSTQIYIWHPIFHTILFFVSKKLGILKIYEILAPVLVFVSIIVCCIFCKNIKNRFKNNIIIR